MRPTFGNRQKLAVLAGFGSAAMLIAAFGFQAMGYAPCKLCLWQRWPHGIAFAIGLIFAFGARSRGLAILGALAAAATGALGIYHAGVELGWWIVPSTCTSKDISGLSSEELLNQILAAPLVRCDEIAWQFLGLSMASWNAILSFTLMAIWIAASRTRD